MDGVGGVRDAAHEDEHQSELFPGGQPQLPHHGQGQQEHEHVGGDVHGAVRVVGLDEDDAVARFVDVPVLGDGRAAEDERDQVAEQVAGDEEEDGPGRVAEAVVDAEESEVHEQQGDPVAEDAE